MNERLIFPDQVLLDWGKQLLVARYPFVKITDVAEYSCPFSIDVELDLVDRPTFYRWVLEADILKFCYNTSLETLDPPMWMKVVQEQINKVRRLTGKDDSPK